MQAQDEYAVLTKDNSSSHNIAIFGGGLPTKAYNTVHILSLPSFQWFLANDEQHSTNSKAPGERDAVTCHQVSSTKRYLMTIGGRKFGEILDNFCDVPGAYLFDLSSLSWTDQYDPKGKPYEVPLPIQRNVGGKYDCPSSLDS